MTEWVALGSLCGLIPLCGTRGLTFGAHWKCIPGTGSVVTYIVMQRYRYKVPMIKKNLRPTMDLKGTQKWGETGLPVVCLIINLFYWGGGEGRVSL